jgi:hypothetical protein
VPDHRCANRRQVVGFGALALALCWSGGGALAAHDVAPRHSGTHRHDLGTPSIGITAGSRSLGGSTTHARTVEISAVGDTELGNTPRLPRHPATYLSHVDRVLRGRAQIVFGNLEGTLTTRSISSCTGPTSYECFSFRTPPHYARYLAADGFTVLNDANNHSLDFGAAGRRQTIGAIHRAGMVQTGLPGEITVMLHLPAAAALIRKAHAEAPVVVVYMHAGAEGAYARHVTGHEEYFDGEDRGNPEEFAHLAIRNGASLVIASGPHVVRGMQFYRHRLIAYSLGDFANYRDFPTGGILANSAILHVTLSADGAFRSARLHSVSLDRNGRPGLGGKTVSLVRKLSKKDFGHHRARLASDGRITP